MAVHHGELGSPTMAKAMLSNSSYTGTQAMGQANFISSSTRNSQADALNQFYLTEENQKQVEKVRRAIVRETPTKQEPTAMPNRRIVQVYIADPSDDVPLADAILYTGEQKMTDLTDQELFFEIDIRALLEAHNTKRTQIINKKIKDRTEYLEPAKVRDLKMVVVDVASF